MKITKVHFKESENLAPVTFSYLAGSTFFHVEYGRDSKMDIQLPEHCRNMSEEGIKSLAEYYYRKTMVGTMMAEFFPDTVLRLANAYNKNIKAKYVKAILHESLSESEFIYHLIDENGQFAGVYNYEAKPFLKVGHPVELSRSAEVEVVS